MSNKILKNVERPYFLMAAGAAVNLAVQLSKLGGYLKTGTEVSNFRRMFAFMTSQKKFDRGNIRLVDKRLDDIPVRVYLPPSEPSKSTPVMIYYHGGGFVFGTLNSYDPFLSEFVKRLNMAVISVDYRLAPEHPHPGPVDDCFRATQYILSSEFAAEFNLDLDRLVLAGDSAGGNALAVLIQRMIAENLRLPKIQVLIYPWLQMFSFKLPSALEYSNKVLMGQKLILWYLGVTEITKSMVDELTSNNHTNLLTDSERKEKIKSYLDVDLIPDKYKHGKEYYAKYEPIAKKSLFPESKSLLSHNSELGDLLKKIADPTVSPLFYDDEHLAKLPKTYLLVLEWDSLKDECLLYAERLKRNKVDVEVAFYERAFHGIAGMTDERLGFQVARDMQNDLIEYLRTHL